MEKEEGGWWGGLKRVLKPAAAGGREFLVVKLPGWEVCWGGWCCGGMMALVDLEGGAYRRRRDVTPDTDDCQTGMHV